MQKGEKKCLRKPGVFYILSPDYNKILKELEATQLAELLGIKRQHLDCYLATHPTYKGCPIAEK